jgi:hypothetical protein
MGPAAKYWEIYRMTVRSMILKLTYDQREMPKPTKEKLASYIEGFFRRASRKNAVTEEGGKDLWHHCDGTACGDPNR